jgi:hypothetical protein
MGTKRLLKLLGIPTMTGLVMAILVPTSVLAGGFMVSVPPPTGDDTAILQGALNACVAHGPGCTVELGSGTYMTKQLLVNNFSGTIVGHGQTGTVVQALPGYIVGSGPVLNSPPSATNPYPFIMSFGGVSSVTMSDFTFRVTEFNPTTGWQYHPTGAFAHVTWLKGDVYVQGSSRFTRMSFEGAAGSDPITPGFNVDNSVLDESMIPGGGSTGPGGVFKMTSSRVINDGNGFELAYFSGSATIGGSPSAGNVFLHSAGGAYALSNGATVEESYNRIQDDEFGDSAMLFVGLANATIPPRVVLMHNMITMDGSQQGGAIEAFTPLRLVAIDNDITLGGDGVAEGIGFGPLTGAVILGNTIRGNGYDAIGLYGPTTFTGVIGNEISLALFPGGLGFQIFLDVPTTKNLVVCAEPTDTILNLGVDNKILNCGQSAPAPATGRAAPTAPAPRPAFPGAKLSVP